MTDKLQDAINAFGQSLNPTPKFSAATPTLLATVEAGPQIAVCDKEVLIDLSNDIEQQLSWSTDLPDATSRVMDVLRSCQQRTPEPANRSLSSLEGGPTKIKEVARDLSYALREAGLLDETGPADHAARAAMLPILEKMAAPAIVEEGGVGGWIQMLVGQSEPQHYQVVDIAFTCPGEPEKMHRTSAYWTGEQWINAGRASGQDMNFYTVHYWLYIPEPPEIPEVDTLPIPATSPTTKKGPAQL